MEAEEDDAEDEDEDDDGMDHGIVADEEVEDAVVDRERDHVRAQRMERERAMNNDDPHALAQYFSERYEREDYETGEAGAPETSGIDQQSLLPSVRDPRIWIVRCTRPGYERKAIFSLLQKMFNLKKRGEDIGIFSAVAPEHLKGKIYIEAFSAAQVQLAVNGLQLFSTYGGVKALRLDEMPEILKLGKRPDKQVNANWVRIKRRDSIYRGDLAQVCNVRDGSNEAQISIRLIPRLDLKGKNDCMDEVDKDEEFVTDLDTGTQRKGRPPQKLFDKKDLYRLTGSSDVYLMRDRETGEVFEVWNKEFYRFGLLYMKVRVKSLVTGEDVQPTVEELEKWIVAEKHMKMMFEEDPATMDADVAGRGLELDITSVAGRKTTKLFKGDSVRVTQGEQKGLEGAIVTIDGDVVLVRVADFPEPIRVSRAHLAKNFKIGEHVKVSSGKKAGYAGAIVRVEGDFLTIFTDSTREEIKVLSSQVADSADVNADVGVQRASGGQGAMRYELFDLVQMLHDSNEKGVVIQVQNESLTLLTPQNTQRVVPIAGIKCKVRDNSVRALDARGNPIAPNDTIHVMTGPLQNRQGVVMHVAGNTVFFKARDEVNYCGMLAVVAQSCTASTAAARRLTSTINGNNNSQAKMPAPIPRGAGGGMTGGGRGGSLNSRDPMMRKEVRIKQGQYKGYTAKVLDVQENTFRVLLASKQKVITLPRSSVKDMSAPSDNTSSLRMSSLGRGLRGRGVTPGMGGLSRPLPSQTPRANAMYGDRTPHRMDSFGTTPRHPSATPRPNHHSTPAHHGSMSTPGHDAFSRMQTPGRDDRVGGNPYQMRSTGSEGNPYMTGMPQTPATPVAGGMPSTPMSGPYGGQEPRTPAGIVEPSTPAYSGMEPRTPAPGLEPTTPAPGMEPRTPAPGQEPHTPGPGMEPSTPMVQEPATPHTPGTVPQTPHGGEEESGVLGYRVLVDVEVLVRGENNFPAKVIDAAADGSFIMVKMVGGDTEGKELEVPISEITPVQPRAEVGTASDLIKVLDGAYASRIGRLLNVIQGQEDMEGLIRFEDGGEEATLNMSLVAKCSER